MTYKFYGENGSELEIYNNYSKQTIVIEVNGEPIQLDEEDTEDLIIVLEILKNKQIDYEQKRHF